MHQAQKDYEKLHELSRHIRILSGISHILEWDQETHMPPEGGTIRGEQLKTLAGIIHREETSPKFKRALAKLINIESGKILGKTLSDPQKVALQRWRRDYKLSTSLPSKFVEEFTKLTSQSQLVWRKAKAENSFQHFAPFLDKIVSMCRKKADLLGYNDHPYDALLDLYERNMTTKEITQVFTPLQKSIVTLLKKINNAKQVNDKFLFGNFDADQQLQFGNVLLACMGYDRTRGRVDISTHPFSSSSHPNDSRITTRIHQTSLMSNISALLHEGGHALYEMGLPINQYGSPLGEAISLGMHESQSRWWETRIGQSKPFWKYFLPILKKHFKGKLDKVSLDAFHLAINKVEPSFIRVEADEVTYPLHVILRFELEKALIEGSLTVRQLPEAWNAKMQELLGITPKNNSEGCLQDVHWSIGGFGYFPTYTLGNLYASQFFNAFEKANPDWQTRVATGDLLFIKDWLNHNIHQHGRLYTSQELIKKVTGKEFSSKEYTDYLNKKYKEIYSLK